MSHPLPIKSLPADEFDSILIEHTRPASWINPQASGVYNLAVIGAGTAGLVAAAGAATLGARVALIESDRMGGDCLNYGCVPSKALIRAARSAYAIREAQEFGIHARLEKCDFAEVMRRVRRVRSEISAHDSVERFRKLGADVYLGEARFLDRNTIEVAGQRLRFRKAIIATGTRPAVPALPGLEKADFLTNKTIFSLAKLPNRLIVIGAGPSGCELAQSFSRLGSRVSIIDMGPQLLPQEDSEASKALTCQFRREGISILTGAKVQRVELSVHAKTVVLDRSQGEERIEGDEILVAVGRTPNVEGLQLEAADVKYDLKNGVFTDAHLRTSNRGIYAAGDVCSPYRFTHAADALSRIALQNALFFARKRADALVIPWCTYTDPEIAHVGINEQTALQQGDLLDTYTLPLQDNDRAIVDGETEGFARVHISHKDGTVLGATLVGRHAGESIGELVLAVRNTIKLGSLSTVIHPYPTQAETIKRLGDAYTKSRFRPWMRKALEKFFQWHRSNYFLKS